MSILAPFWVRDAVARGFGSGACSLPQGHIPPILWAQQPLFASASGDLSLEQCDQMVSESSSVQPLQRVP
jgi:hypothetical protein